MKTTSVLALIAAGTLCLRGAALAQNSGQPKATPSTTEVKKDQPTKKAPAKTDGQAKVGEKAPNFTLTDTDGKTVTLADLTKQNKIVVLEWFNPDCPVVQRCYKEGVMSKVYDAYKGKGNVTWLAINSSGPNSDSGGKDRNVKAKADMKLAYPLLLDESGTVGRAYGSKNTPTMYIIAADGTLAYWGAIDNGNAGKAGTVNYVKKALDEILAGQTVTDSKTTPYGCAVKYATAEGKHDGDAKKDTEKKK
jgi:peroxiredoxin